LWNNHHGTTQNQPPLTSTNPSLGGQIAVVVQPPKWWQMHRPHRHFYKPTAYKGKAFKFATPYVSKTTDSDKKTEENEQRKLKLAKSLEAAAVTQMSEDSN
jgi:hypothetical protein